MPIPGLNDRLREIASIVEGVILKKEAALVALRREVERLKKELAVARDQQLAVRSPKCEGCAYRVIALKSLEAEEKHNEG